MEPSYKNRTNLTLDMYRNGVIAGYKSSHKFVRVISTAYAIVMLIMAVAFFLSLEFMVSGVFALLGGLILIWNIWGYRMGTKKSFMDFARLHDSHYQVDMEFRFYEERLEQETTKTEMAVMYKDIDVIYNTDEYFLIVFDKKLIIVEKSKFVDETAENVIKFLKGKGIKVVNSTY